jgi:hypothetical protein
VRLRGPSLVDLPAALVRSIDTVEALAAAEAELAQQRPD